MKSVKICKTCGVPVSEDVNHKLGGNCVMCHSKPTNGTEDRLNLEALTALGFMEKTASEMCSMGYGAVSLGGDNCWYHPNVGHWWQGFPTGKAVVNAFLTAGYKRGDDDRAFAMRAALKLE